ncbi:MAG: bacteriohemerythrin [Desulfuromonadales bacterium]|nr:bacteriohemerythrin [Desulfuromonadales bacterium]
MDSFLWDKHFETGLPSVDDQHRHLVDIINQFGRLSAANELIFEDIQEILARLSDYANCHFQEEEELMAHAGVERRFLESHIKAHRAFLREVTTIHSEISPENPGAAGHLLEFLTHWLAYHILGTDQKMARQVAAIQQGMNPEDAFKVADKQEDSATKALLVALNNLFQMVSARNNELVKLNLSLEAKVARRTAALSQANRHLEELALTDVLTGIPNRRHAMHSLANRWEESARNNTPLVCTMVDADHFKTINDTYGHDAGDAVLIELSKTLQLAFRSYDIVCRLGGDEFLIICPNTPLESGVRIAERTRQMVAKLRVPTGEGFWNGSISVGVAAKNAEMSHYEDLIKRADTAVYAAKQAGRNCVRSIG